MGKVVANMSMSLAPVLLGGGTPFFAGPRPDPVLLGTPTVVQGRGVTHLAYDVRKAA